MKRLIFGLVVGALLAGTIAEAQLRREFAGFRPARVKLVKLLGTVGSLDDVTMAGAEVGDEIMSVEWHGAHGRTVATDSMAAVITENDSLSVASTVVTQDFASGDTLFVLFYDIDG